MLATLLQAAFAFVLTGVIGGRIAHVWQARAAREARFFDASKDMYNQMVGAADDLSALIGKRLYSSQRVCLVKRGTPSFDEAVSGYRSVIIEWNERFLSLELAVRTKFRHASLNHFEHLQKDLVNVTTHIDNYIKESPTLSNAEMLNRIRLVRASFFSFTANMMREAKLLHRQMHFGVVVKYDHIEIDKMSTQNLIKSLFTSRIEGEAVVRSPSDFGLPVSVNDARFGIYE